MKKIIFLIALSFYSFGESVTRVFDISEPTELNRGVFNGLFLDDSNGFGLTENVSVLSNVDVKMAWRLYETKKNLFVGIEKEGSIYKIDKKTKEKIKIKIVDKGDIISMVEYEDYLYIAFSNPSVVYKMSLSNNNLIEKVIDVNVSYIWDMKIQKDVLYFSTGNPGQIHTFDLKNNEVNIFFDNDDKNIVKIHFHNKKLYAITSKIGYVYEISQQDDFNILYTSEKADITDFVFWNDDLYITTAGIRNEKIQEKSVVLKIDSDKNIIPVYETDDALTSIIVDKDRLLFSTYDMLGGYLYEYFKKKEKIKEIYRTNRDRSTFITNFVKTDENILFLTSSGQILTISNEKKNSGYYLSRIYDTGAIATWGKFHYKSTDDGLIRLFTKTGMTPVIDSSWTDWVELKNTEIQSLKGRYIRVKVLYEEQSIIAKNTIWDMKLFYSINGIKNRIINFSLTRDVDVANNFKVNLGLENLLIYWRIEKPIENNAFYRLHYKKHSESNWGVLIDNFNGGFLPVNRFLFPEGYYDFKLSLIDNPNHSMSMKILKKIAIDNTNPEVKMKYKQGSLIGINVTDNMSLIKNVRYSFDLKGFWYSLVPEDKTMDSKEEYFTIDINEEEKNREYIYIYVEDNFGNYSYKRFSIN